MPEAHAAADAAHQPAVTAAAAAAAATDAATSTHTKVPECFMMTSQLDQSNARKLNTADRGFLLTMSCE